MEGRIYTVVFDRVSVTAIQDLFTIQPASNKPCTIVGLKIVQSSDFGDAQDEGLTIRIKRLPATATIGSGGTAPTPQGVDATGASAGFTAHVNDTTQATSTGTVQLLDCDVFIVRAGLLWVPPERMAYDFVNGTLGVVDLPAAPADALTMSGTLFVEEHG